MSNLLLKQDRIRYSTTKMPEFQKYYRLSQECSFKLLQLVYRFLFKRYKQKNMVEMSYRCQVGGGLYLGHPYCITINPATIIGSNVNIHRGVVLGQENRGKRKGAPVIGNNVWIGINAAIVGHVRIGNDVLIAPNSYVNCDIPDHSIVFGNPCVIHHRNGATEGYINNTVDNNLSS